MSYRKANNMKKFIMVLFCLFLFTAGCVANNEEPAESLESPVQVPVDSDESSITEAKYTVKDNREDPKTVFTGKYFMQGGTPEQYFEITSDYALLGFPEKSKNLSNALALNEDKRVMEIYSLESLTWISFPVSQNSSINLYSADLVSFIEESFISLTPRSQNIYRLKIPEELNEPDLDTINPLSFDIDSLNVNIDSTFQQIRINYPDLIFIDYIERNSWYGGFALFYSEEAEYYFIFKSKMDRYSTSSPDPQDKEIQNLAMEAVQPDEKLESLGVYADVLFPLMGGRLFRGEIDHYADGQLEIGRDDTGFPVGSFRFDDHTFWYPLRDSYDILPWSIVYIVNGETPSILA